MSTKILIVEDEQLVAADLQAKLTRLGHVVVGQASSGEEAISLAAETQPDLVLMDVRLQGSIDGVETARRLRDRTEVKIVFVTAYAQVSVPGCANLPGLCLNKPYSTGQLKAILQTALYPTA